MRVLLDEDLPPGLRFHFGRRFRVESVQYRGWKGVKNGALLRLAEREFDVLATLDKHPADQQNLARFDLAVAILCPRTQATEHLVQLVPELKRVLPGLRPGEVTRIHMPG